MNGRVQDLLKVVVEEYHKTKAPVPRNKVWRELMPNAYARHNGCNMCDDIRQLQGLKLINYTQRGYNLKLEPAYRNTSFITPTSAGIEYVKNMATTAKEGEPETIIKIKPPVIKPPVIERLERVLAQGQQAMPLAQEISRLDLDAKNQEIATLKSINAEQAEEIKSLKRKLAKLASVVSMDDLLAMI